MRSVIDFWHRSPFDPTKELATSFRVIAMDQRNAGLSRAPVSASDSWESFAADQLALLDHLKIRQCHIMGGCIGSSYCLALIKAAPAARQRGDTAKPYRTGSRRYRTVP